MVEAITAQFPIFTGGESFGLYHPSARERYVPVAPGIEVSVQRAGELPWEQERETQASVYNRKGHLDSYDKKGVFVDAHL